MGVATQDPVLRQRFSGKPEEVVNFFFFVAEEARRLMAQLGVRRFDDLIGRADLLDTRKGVAHWKAQGLDFSRVLALAPAPADVPRRHVDVQAHGLENALDQQLIAQAQVALAHGQPQQLRVPARNVHRSVGAMLSGELIRRHPDGLPDGCLQVQLRAQAGSFRGLPGPWHHLRC